jgi:type II secretory pathway pseudopilin PulG
VRAIDSEGFTLIELLAALLLTILIGAGGILLVRQAADAAYVVPEAVDLHERARLALHRIARDLEAAGAGPTVDPAAGPLAQYFAPVLPRRIGSAGDAPSAVRADAVSVISLAETPVQAVLARPSSGTTLGVQPGPGCQLADPVCGIRSGTELAIFDDTGRFDLATATAVTGSDVTIRPHGASIIQPYEAGMPVVEVRAQSYYFDSALGQLRHYDTDVTDRPMIDGVVAFSVEYFGAPLPPLWPKPPIGISNCLYDGGGVLNPSLQVLAPAPGRLTPLPVSLFADGPWCGDGPMRFDADVLRIRYIRLSLRVEVPLAWRSSSVQHANPGRNESAWRTLPDYSLTVGVAPRNLEVD